MAANPASAQETDIRSIGPWHTTVEVTDHGHMIGDPASETVLTEFISYTCAHCAKFAVEGEPRLEIALIASGKMRLEVRSFIRNALDLTVSMLVACGEPRKFKGNHAAFLRSQDRWLEAARNAPQAQQAIWGRGDRSARLSMASALGLSDKMTRQRGYSVIEINRCLSDDAFAAQLMNNTNDARAEFAIADKPSFALDGEILPNVHEWRTLYPVLITHFQSLEGADREPELGESQFD
ncbi:MAG: thioredoxin domain-containing protein [Erythrobacter sp.]